ncbi:MAG: hypothetical protein M3Y27_14065, partial [Acidobacteriota bacterium]|nr:hypothetical protein [Acidobacteriota bacterium]
MRRFAPILSVIPGSAVRHHRNAHYRSFVDEITSRKNARNAQRIDAERATLQSLPQTRTSDYEQTW